MIDVYYWSPKNDCPHKGYWATAMIEDLFNGKIWLPNERYEFNIHEGKPGPDVRGCVLVVPGRFETPELFEQVQTVLDGLDWVIFFYVADEDQASHWWELKHDNAEFFVQAAKKDQIDTVCAAGVFPHIIPFGYTPHTRETIRTFGHVPNRQLQITFMGQDTHQRRHQLVRTLNDMPLGKVTMSTSKQFAGGIAPEEYIKILCNSQIVPAPGGPVAIDSFRLYEGLEAGCMVVADCRAGNGTGQGYWYDIFINELPFLTIQMHWDELAEVKYSADLVLEHQEAWREYKRNLTYRVHSSISARSELPFDTTNNMTYIITTSPIESHPDTSIIEETINSIRYWDKTSEIVIIADGVRQEQEHLRFAYGGYLDRLNWLVNHQWSNVHLYSMGYFQHQVKMTQYALDYFVGTELVCFLEHDTPLVTDECIEWNALKALVINDKYDVVRLYHEGQIPQEHLHLFPGTKKPQVVDGVRVIRTHQWSQRPHIATANYYRKILRENFTEEAVTFIEDKMHSVAQCDPADHRIAIYAPLPRPGQPSNWKRSLHSDGRAGGPKFDDVLVF